MLEIESQYVELAVDDDTMMRAWFASPQAATRGILVFQEAFGVNAHIRDVTERFARKGYAAIAPELYHRTHPGFEADYSDSATAIAIARQSNPEEWRIDIRAAFKFLRETVGANIASVGYCLGGTVSYVANTTVPLKAAVSYYGGRITDMLGSAPQSSAPMLFFWGGRDKHIDSAKRQKVEEGMQASPRRSIQVVFSDADHGFFCDQRASYNSEAAQLAWPLTLAFFAQNLVDRQGSPR